MFTLITSLKGKDTTFSSASCQEVECLIYADTPGEAWRKILKSRLAFQDDGPLSYYLFETSSNFSLTTDVNNFIKFTFPSKSNVRTSFVNFCIKHFNEIKLVWSTDEFAEHYQELVNTFIQDGCSPPASDRIWDLSLVPVKKVPAYPTRTLL
jgi:hypothetical protein